MTRSVLKTLSAIDAENDMNDTSDSLQAVVQQLPFGAKIDYGADDAAAVSHGNGLEAAPAALKQSKTDTTEGVGQLRVWVLGNSLCSCSKSTLDGPHKACHQPGLDPDGHFAAHQLSDRAPRTHRISAPPRERTTEQRVIQHQQQPVTTPLHRPAHRNLQPPRLRHQTVHCRCRSQHGQAPEPRQRFP